MSAAPLQPICAWMGTERYFMPKIRILAKGLLPAHPSPYHQKEAACPTWNCHLLSWQILASLLLPWATTTSHWAWYRQFWRNGCARQALNHLTQRVGQQLQPHSRYLQVTAHVWAILERTCCVLMRDWTSPVMTSSCSLTSYSRLFVLLAPSRSVPLQRRWFFRGLTASFVSFGEVWVAVGYVEGLS